MRKFIIDTDTGSDDAVALMMALLDDSVAVLGITTVCGNVSIEHATPNALMTTQVCQKSTPVYEGHGKPLLRDLVTAVSVHGDDGMGDRDLIHPTAKAQKQHAVDFILETVKNNPGEVEIVTLGPLTNIAMAILQDRTTMQKVKHIYTMGTAGLGRGNTTPVACFNVYVDADAFDIFIKSGIPITILGFDMCLGSAALSKNDMEYLTAKGPIGKFAVDCNAALLQYNLKRTNEHMVDLPDAVAMAVALWSDTIVEASPMFAHCCTGDDATYGQVIFYDRNDVLAIAQDIPPNNVTLIRKIDVPLYKKRLLACVGR